MPPPPARSEPLVVHDVLSVMFAPEHAEAHSVPPPPPPPAIASTQVTPETGEESVHSGVVVEHEGADTLALLRQIALAPPPPPPVPFTTGVPLPLTPEV